jgi:hypothetical protein
MMGRQTVDQSQLFYLFNLEKRIPARHLLRRINPTVMRILAECRDKLEPFYSEIGRPRARSHATSTRTPPIMPARSWVRRSSINRATSARKSRCALRT